MQRPNILWLVTTQWRAQALGVAGDPNARTPCLDALAAESVHFTQAVTPHPFGPLARAALLTGVRSPENGVRDYYDPLPFGTRTIAHDLSARGYHTAFFGQWQLSQRDPTTPLVGEAHARALVPPEGRGGFDFWEGFAGGFLLNDPWLHGTRLPTPVQMPGYQSDVLCERAAEWLQGPSQEKFSQPWFCLVNLEAPHPPYDAPASGVAPRADGDLVLTKNVPHGGMVEARARRELAGYYAHLEATDRALGRMLAKITPADPLASNSPIVVCTSVHGDMHGAHGLFRKGWPYEESVRVPLLVRGWPRRVVTPGARTEAVSLQNLRALTRAWADGEFPGWASIPTHAQISMPCVVARPHQCDRVWRGVRTPHRKLILNADGTPWLFFDLADDPLEQNNLTDSPAHAGERAALAKQVAPG